MRIACGFDHAGVPLRDAVVAALEEDGHAVIDVGTFHDYPFAAAAVGRALGDGADRAVLVCGSGAGVAVAAAKLPGVRAATIHDGYTAHQSVEHDDLNVACLGARVVGPELAGDLVRAFASATFSGAERHRRRLAQVAELEERGLDGLDGPPPEPDSSEPDVPELASPEPMTGDRHS